MGRFVGLILGGLAAAAVAGGCAPAKNAPAARTRTGSITPTRAAAATPPPRTSPRPGSRGGAGAGAGAGGTSAPLAATDPCAVRLHDICGPLLLYYVTNHRLPERLDELAAFADADTDFQTTCPVSGQPYVYVPSGVASGTGRVLLVYDPTPAHGGVRWVIAASPPEGDRPLTTWVMPFDEEHFRRLVPRPGG